MRLWSASLILLLFGCSASSRSSAQSPAAVTSVLLDGQKVQHGKMAIAVPQDERAMAVPQLTKSLRASLNSKEESPSLQLEVSADTPVLLLLRVLLSAGVAGFERAFVVTDGDPLELVIPDSEAATPTVMADLFVMILEGRVGATRELEGMGATDSPSIAPALNSPGKLRALIGPLCVPAGTCSEVVVGSPASTRWGQISDLLSELKRVRGAEGTLRFVVNGAPRAPTRAMKKSEGILARGEILGVISQERAALVACQEAASVDGDMPRGTIVVDFTVSKLGLVFESSADQEKSTLDDSQLVDCVVDRFTRMRFPKPEGGSVSFRYIVRY